MRTAFKGVKTTSKVGQVATFAYSRPLILIILQ
jgi:hypothetical protein